jgi:hypothetical protein
MRPVSGKRVVWVAFGVIALVTGLAVWWFVTHAAAVRSGPPPETIAPASTH